MPAAPKLYHITHVDNLPSMLTAGGLASDVRLAALAGPATSIGMDDLKTRRLTLPVKCFPGDVVGGYVPFYFCPRSIMLFLIYRANHPKLTYRGGQGPILHLELDLYEVVAWANAQPRRWAFTLSNGSAYYAEFRNRLDQLDQIDWQAVAATNFTDSKTKEGKQAEFLVQDFVPWELVRRIGSLSDTVQRQALRAMSGVAHRPPVEIRRDWYYC